MNITRNVVPSNFVTVQDLCIGDHFEHGHTDPHLFKIARHGCGRHSPAPGQVFATRMDDGVIYQFRGTTQVRRVKEVSISYNVEEH